MKNNIKGLKDYLKKDNYFISYLLTLLLITVIITYYKIQVQMTMGPMWDAFDFLANAKYFAGQGFGYIDPARPPFLSFLTSLLFRAGFESEIAIFIVDGILFILGVIGLYLFFNLRFKPLLSFIGSLFYVSFPVVLLWVGAGYTDVASASLSIWALYFTVLAVKRNSKFFYISFPVFTLAFLTRYPSAILIFPIAFYVLINDSLKNNLKDIIMGIIASIPLLIPALIFYYNNFGNPITPLLGFYSATTAQTAGPRFAYNPEIWYYFKNSLYSLINLDFLNSPYWIVMIIFAVIAVLMGYMIILGTYINIRQFLISRKERLNLKNIKNRKILFLACFLVLFLISFNKVNYLVSISIFSISSYILYLILRSDDLENLDLDMLFLLWLASYLIFHSVYSVKVIRYFIPMAPAISYFILMGLSGFTENTKIKIRNISIKNGIYILLVFALLISSIQFVYQLEHDPIANGQNFSLNISDNGQREFIILNNDYSGELYHEIYNTHNELKMISSWLENHDPDYKNKIICTDYFWPHLRWYFKKNIYAINVFDKERDGEINDILIDNEVDYFISLASNQKLNDYEIIASFKTRWSNIIIFKKK
ncbi:glycosyltransferase family 39 protein [Methanobacterium alkalithermotolerans]|uniref:Glycosyltransferase family 39 protein n=1 Tax=Methanobacterium alkalithermotolerans TaxID=2731220 RepID=A0A8T8KF19_9EURY|nr:glycosyltransferase family 39 protein [Methanobacterium alkalithermotolerans]QUH23881.1 glycosyltransferase family 39 protein [Methanobacterium alkalithermotolerans]